MGRTWSHQPLWRLRRHPPMQWGGPGLTSPSGGCAATSPCNVEDLVSPAPPAPLPPPPHEWGGDTSDGLLGGEPAFEHRGDDVELHRFGHVVVHARGEASLPLPGARVPGPRDDRHAPPAPLVVPELPARRATAHRQLLA